jgi:hypothetical protein
VQLARPKQSCYFDYSCTRPAKKQNLEIVVPIALPTEIHWVVTGNHKEYNDIYEISNLRERFYMQEANQHYSYTQKTWFVIVGDPRGKFGTF